MRIALIALACACALSGCSAAAAIPADPTPDEAVALQDAEAAQWWDAMFPGEPMPQVALVQSTTPQSRPALVTQCLEDSVPPDAPYAIEAIGDGWTVTGEFDQSAIMHLQWVCAQQFRLDPAGDHGLLTAEQLDYAYDYLIERSVPCLEQLGYAVGEPPDRDDFMTTIGYPGWSPYWLIGSPTPDWPASIQRAVAQCPPPPVGTGWAPEPG